MKNSLWRELVMGVGLACLMVSGLVVGKQYFNHTMDGIFSESKTIRISTK